MELLQIIPVTLMNLRNLPARWGASLVSVIGIGGVVLVLVATLAISEGFRAALDLAGADDVAIVLRGGSADELSSGLSGAEINIIMDAPGILRRDGQPVASPELYVVVDVPKRGAGTQANVPFRGVGPMASAVRSHFRLIAGRQFQPGVNEVIVGRGAAGQFRGLALGQRVKFGSQSWLVVGIFEDAGSVAESEIWTDAHLLQDAYQRGNSYQSVRVRLPSASALATLQKGLRADPRLNVAARSEREFLAEQSRVLIGIVTTVGAFIALLMGIGAVFGALNTMYSAVAARTREIATLRAIGFGAAPVVISVLVEAMLLGTLGGVLGGGLAYFGLNGYQTSTLNFQTFSQVTFAFTVTPRVLVTGVVYALILGLIGGLLPGIRAATASITAGLRSG